MQVSLHYLIKLFITMKQADAVNLICKPTALSPPPNFDLKDIYLYLGNQGSVISHVVAKTHEYNYNTGLPLDILHIHLTVMISC